MQRITGSNRPAGAKPVGENLLVKGSQKEFKDRKLKEPSFKDLCEQWEKILKED